MKDRVQTDTIIVSLYTYYVNHYRNRMRSLKICKNSQGYFSLQVSHELPAGITQFRDRI